MAGEPKTNVFNISAATVMIGPMDSVEDLTPEEHSVGLVKNFSFTNQLNYVELTYGLHGDMADSQATSSDTSATFEVYEYTPENLGYSLGLEGSKFVANGMFTVSEAVTGGESATKIKIAADSDPSAKFTADSTVMIQASGQSKSDKVLLRKVASASWTADGEGPKGTLEITLKSAVPTGWSFVAGDRVVLANIIPVGSEEAQPYFGMKVVGVLPNDNKPVVIIFPKIRITNGFSLGFQTDDYQNLPFEITPYKLLPTDALYESHGNCLAYVVE